MNPKNHPGVYVPPPLIYVAFFLSSFFLQRVLPLNNTWLGTTAAKITGGLLIVMYFIFCIPALRRFILSKNTLVTIKPANSLQTSGIYSITRNPMYLSLLFLYSGLAVFFGNWWTVILLPLLVVIIRWYVIQKEEEYLQRTFGSEYNDYRKRVRRWI